MDESNKIISLLNRKVLNDKLRDYKKSSNSLKNQIGELKEKNIHHILKNLISDVNNQEVKVGNYYADCVNDNIIYEIQTRQFNKLRPKLNYFILDHKVVVIYPIIYKRDLIWITNDGEVTSGKKTTNNSKFNSVFPEIYKIKDLLKNGNIALSLLLINVCEYRKVTGFTKIEKKKAEKIDKDLLEIVDCFNILSIDDYEYFVREFVNPFTTKDYKNINKTKIKEATIALNILNYLGLIKRIGKKGRMYLYQKNKEK